MGGTSCMVSQQPGWVPSGPNSDQRRGTIGSESLDLSGTRTSTPQIHPRTGLLKRSNDLKFPEETVENTASHPGNVGLSPWAKQWLGRKGKSTNVTSSTTREDDFISSTEPSPSKLHVKVFELLGVKQGQKRKANEM